MSKEIALPKFRGGLLYLNLSLTTSYPRYVCVYKLPLSFSYFLKKIVSVIDVSIFCVNIIKLFFVYMCIKFDFFIF